MKMRICEDQADYEVWAIFGEPNSSMSNLTSVARYSQNRQAIYFYQVSGEKSIIAKADTGRSIVNACLRIKPLERIVLEEDSPENFISIWLLDLLHMNAMKLCRLCFAWNECSKHEVAVTSPTRSYVSSGSKANKGRRTSQDMHVMDHCLAGEPFQASANHRLIAQLGLPSGRQLTTC